MVSLDTILEDLDKFIAPTDKVIAKVTELTIKIRDRLADFAIASKIKRVANLCIQRKMFQRAYDFALINAMQFEQINELEQAGGFCEQIAREFEEKNYYFAAKLYMKSAEYYSAVEEELKANRSFARAFRTRHHHLNRRFYGLLSSTARDKRYPVKAGILFS